MTTTWKTPLRAAGRAVVRYGRTSPAAQKVLTRSTTYHALELSLGWLRSSGWLRSMVDGKPVDAAGNPLPWITYPAIDFLRGQALESLRVFEWGSGSSTEWWARQVQAVVACEHDPAWCSQVRGSLPANAMVVLRDRGDAYTGEVLQHGPFDIIVIDGRDRVACSRVAPDALTAAGIIIWDNADRERYQEGLDRLAAQGFRRVDFHGLVPALQRPSVTSLLYRSDNIFGL
jgi:hypothetical protein